MDRQLIVAGFHRSGTSLLAELLHRAGLFLGDELLGALPSNPHGHFEDLEVMRLHQQILDRNQVGWQMDTLRPLHIGADHWQRMADIVSARRSRHQLWGFKDPRSCFFLGAWEHLLPDMRVVGVYRNPADSISSLERRHATNLIDGEGTEALHRRFWTEPDHGLRLWMAHNEALLAHAAKRPGEVVLVSFRDLRDGFPIVSALNAAFELGLDEIPTHAVFDPSVTTERPTRLPVSDSRLTREMVTLWDRLERASASFAREFAHAT